FANRIGQEHCEFGAQLLDPTETATQTALSGLAAGAKDARNRCRTETYATLLALSRQSAGAIDAAFSGVDLAKTRSAIHPPPAARRVVGGGGQGPRGETREPAGGGGPVNVSYAPSFVPSAPDLTTSPAIRFRNALVLLEAARRAQEPRPIPPVPAPPVRRGR